MSKALSRLVEERQRIDRSIATERRRLRRTCSHAKLIQTNAAVAGYLYMCTRCGLEEHGWATYKFGLAKGYAARPVTWDEFFAARFPGGLELIRPAGT